MQQHKNATSLGAYLRRLSGQRVRPTEALYLLLGKQDWIPIHRVRYLITNECNALNLFWDAVLIESPPGSKTHAGISLFGPDKQIYRAFDLEEGAASLLQEQKLSIELALQQLQDSAWFLQQLHETYISDDWGRSSFTGKTYRQMGALDWDSAAKAFVELQNQATAQPALLSGSSIRIFTNSVQALRIRLSQRFAENLDDPQIQHDATFADKAWAELNMADQWLYQRLG